MGDYVLSLLAKTSNNFNQPLDLLIAQGISPRRHHRGPPRALPAPFDDPEEHGVRIFLHDLTIGKVGGFRLQPLSAWTIALAANPMAHRTKLSKKRSRLICRQ